MESSCQSGANIDGGMLWLGLDYSTINNNYPCSLTQVLMIKLFSCGGELYT